MKHMRLRRTVASVLAAMLMLSSVPEAVFCVVMLVLCIAAVTSDTYNPFIYFQF